MSNTYVARQRLALCAYLAIGALEPLDLKLIHVQRFDFLNGAVHVTAVYQVADLVEN
jgi:hypothetical protein